MDYGQSAHTVGLGFRISNTGISKAKKFQALNNYQLVVKWCLGLQLDTSRGTSCALCPDVALDPLDHHAATCRHGGDIVVGHHKLCDVFLTYCHIAELEAGRCLTRGLDHIHLADVLVRDWARLMYVRCMCVLYLCVHLSHLSQSSIWASWSDHRLELDLSR